MRESAITPKWALEKVGYAKTAQTESKSGAGAFDDVMGSFHLMMREVDKRCQAICAEAYARFKADNGLSERDETNVVASWKTAADASIHAELRNPMYADVFMAREHDMRLMVEG